MISRISWLFSLIFCQNLLFSQTNPSTPNGQGQGTFQAQGNLPAVGLNNGKPAEAGYPSPDQGGDGIIWDGKSFKVTDLRAIDSKFSVYLNEPEISFAEEKEYAGLFGYFSLL